LPKINTLSVPIIPINLKDIIKGFTSSPKNLLLLLSLKFTAMAFSKEQLEEMARSVPFWWHSIDLGNGVITNGFKSVDHLTREFQSLQPPELRGKSVLDIGAWDGFFAFEAERRGAKRVLALDHYIWSLDIPEHRKHWAECQEQGISPKPYHEMPYWRPTELPGKQGYDTAHRALNSQVETLVADFMEVDLNQLGIFDVVFYLGVLYHMENPLEALKRLAAVTGEVAIIETEAVVFPGYEHLAVCEFFESNELNGDVSNWWAPNEKALIGMCRASGFKRVDIILGSPQKANSKGLRTAISRLLSSSPVGKNNGSSSQSQQQVERYRAIVHAWKQ
jgi:tRNA (mo5U34)-methyltransferase